MSVGLQRATIFAIRKETTAGTYLVPNAGSQFVPLRPGNTLNFSSEKLENDELLNDIGASKASIGKETVEGSHTAYLRHSGIEGQEPELGVLYESLFGSKTVNGTEYTSASGSDTTKVVNASPSNFYVGQALLLKSGSGYQIRNIASISSNDLLLNFEASNSTSGLSLGKAITYIPTASGHPTFSVTKYLGNGHAIEASAGNTVTELAVTADANGFGEVSFSYAGTKYFFNPLIVTSSNKYLDFTDDNGTHAVTVAEKVYKTPIELADALQSAMAAASAETFTVTYNKGVGTFTIASSTSSVLELLWDSGTNTANTIGELIGFTVSADDTGLTTYTSDAAISLSSPVTPSYDSSDAIIIKGAELFIGSSTDNICICAQSVGITIGKEIQDVDCICEESGISEKIAVSRTVEMTVTATLNKHDATLLDALLKNSDLSAMLNAGPKSGGNWIPGKCANFYIKNCTVSSYTTSGDSFIQAEITLSGFVTSSSKDIYINFV